MYTVEHKYFAVAIDRDVVTTRLSLGSRLLDLGVGGKRPGNPSTNYTPQERDCPLRVPLTLLCLPSVFLPESSATQPREFL